MLSHISCPTKAAVLEGRNAGDNIKDKHCFRVRRGFEWPNVQIGKKIFFIKSLTEIMNAIDSCIAKNHFAIQRGIPFLAFVPLATWGSKV